MKRFVFPIAGVAVAATVLTGCGGNSGGSSAAGAAPVKIGVLNPLTGPAATYGEQAKRAIDLAVERVNAKSGKCFNGQPVSAVYADDQATPATGVTAAQKLMTRDKVNAIIGGAGSDSSLAEVTVTKDQIVNVVTLSQADQITATGGALTFQLNNTATANAAAFDSYITHTLKPAAVAYMGVDSSFTVGNLEQITKDLAADDVKLTGSEKYQTDTTDFTPILNKLKATGADTLYVADGAPAHLAAALQQVRQVGGFKTVLVAPGLINQGVIEAAGQPMEGSITGDVYAASVDNPENKAFVEAFEKKYPSMTPSKVEALNYEGVFAVCAAMTNAKSSNDQKKIAAALGSLSLDMPQGTVRFDANRKVKGSSFYIQQVAGGQLKVLKVLNNDQ